jgi:aspartyl-tRNA(Asn)/glutamyl-tRNA(Gln) amidotransferase subunit A
MSDCLTITEAAAALRAGEVTSVGLVEQTIAVADAVDDKLGTFLRRFNAEALEAAAVADAALARGDDLGPLQGIPLGIKDIITTREAPTTAQSLVHDPAWSHGDAVVVERLRGAGGIIMGKLTTMEFAVGVPDATKPFPIPRNPWNVERWAGGSSSGSGNGVAAGEVLGALGTDTGGSIRIPAAFCGITGLMPTFGRVPKSGCVPLGFSLDHIGPMARSARDCALMLSVLAGHHGSDISSLDVPVPDYTAALDGDLTGLRIGIDRLAESAGDARDPALDSVIDAALGKLQGQGAEILEVQVPFYNEMSAVAIVAMACEAFAYHLPDLQTRWFDFFAGTRAIIGTGLLYSGADYVQSQRARRVGQKALAEVYADVDIVLTPTSSAGATAFDDLNGAVERAESGGFGPVHTPYWDATGNPVLTMPMGFTADGLPLGLSVAGRPFEEATVLKVADAFQQATDWHLRVAPMIAEL